MPKKRNKPRKPGPSRGGPRTLRAVTSPPAELARLRGLFFAWLVESGLPVHIDPAAVWNDAVAAVDLAAGRAGLADLHVWTADQIETLAAVAEPDDADALSSLPLLLAFLADTGRWSGSRAQFDAALQSAKDATSPVAELLAELAEVDVDPATEDAALCALPVVAQAEALLRFLLPRRPVTGTGALRRADIAPAAGLVGLDLDGRTPRSMWDVPKLAQLWQAACDAGLLIVTSTEATPTPLAHGWVTGDAEQGRQARRLLVDGYLAHLLTAPPEVPWLPSPLDTLLPVLAAASIGRPMPTAVALGAPDGLLSGPAVSHAELDAVGLPALAALHVRILLDRLADDGILDVSDTVTAVPGLHGVLARFTSVVLRADLQLDAETEAVLDLPAPDPDLTGRAYRLRVELADARPPVWREVLVDPNIALDELHGVLQQLFAWEDYHLHEFVVARPGDRTTRFAPPDPEDDWAPLGEPTVDESLVRLSQLVGPQQGSLRYGYDFGDGWDHRITVVGSEPVSGGALPRCTAGAGAAPQEDSGGIWGWADKVQAAGDPSHPEHSDIREWLGLRDDETLDPAAFDPAEVEERLARLRRSIARRGQLQ